MPLRRRHTPRRLALVALASLAGALGLAPVAGSDPASIPDLQSRIGSQAARERSLTTDVAAFSRLLSALAHDIAVLQRRQRAVEADLARDRAELARITTELRIERARVVRLRARLAQARRVLARRLVEIYESPRPDLITLVLSAHGFADLLERFEFVRHIKRQDRQVIIAVRIAKAAAQRAARALARAERRQRAVVAALEARRRALASMAGALAAKQATYARARADRLAALQATRADRRRLEARLAALEAAQARYVTSTSGPSGPWAIPWSVVQCESGGQNLPPNWAGASGYYQIIPSTWRHFGGSGSAAWQASKGEQDRVATRIWGGGGGAHNWDCWSLIHRR